jgi:D-glycero-D-manno-heptose 1,7-bisphosphate phosphatase
MPGRDLAPFVRAANAYLRGAQLEVPQDRGECGNRAKDRTSATEEAVLNRKPAATAFLDRDGVLNVDKGYVHRPEDLEWIAGAPEAVRLLNRAGYRVVVITNQSGVARGLYDEQAVHRFHAHMQARLAEHGAHVDTFYYCPHHPDGRVSQFAIACDCRKPKAGLLQQAEHDGPVDKTRSFLVGDKDHDLAAARAFGIRGFRFEAEKEPLSGLIRSILRTDASESGLP